MVIWWWRWRGFEEWRFQNKLLPVVFLLFEWPQAHFLWYVLIPNVGQWLPPLSPPDRWILPSKGTEAVLSGYILRIREPLPLPDPNTYSILHHIQWTKGTKEAGEKIKNDSYGYTTFQEWQLNFLVESIWQITLGVTLLAQYTAEPKLDKLHLLYSSRTITWKM